MKTRMRTGFRKFLFQEGADISTGEGEIWNRSGQKGAALRVLRILWTNANDGVVCFKSKRLGALAGATNLRQVLKKLEAAREIKLAYKPSPGMKGGDWIYRLTPARAVAPTPRRRRKPRRKPKAQFVLFKNVFTTKVLVPRVTNATVARFQDVLMHLEPRLRSRPNIAATAGWLLREGFRFASRNRVHGLGRELEAPAGDCVSLGIYVERKTWADVQRWAVVEETTLGTVVPRLIELGAQTCPIREVMTRRKEMPDTPRRQGEWVRLGNRPDQGASPAAGP